VRNPLTQPLPLAGERRKKERRVKMKKCRFGAAPNVDEVTDIRHHLRRST
jgi:hypothetical protein